MPKPGASPSLKWTGTKGDDTVNVASATALATTVYDGAGGNDTLNLSQLASGVSIDVIPGNPGNSRVWANSPFHGSWWDFTTNGPGGSVVDGTIKNIERIVGTNFNDYLELRGGSIARVVDGGAGDDAIYVTGSSGTSTAIGGLGSDQLFGSRNGDLLVGGTYVGGVAPGDDIRDEFEAAAGTILDFEVGVDTLYIDAAVSGSFTTSAVWVDASTSYGSAARLTIAPDRVITVVGVSAETMNALPKGYVIPASSAGDCVSGAGDDFLWDSSTVSVDRFVFPAGSGADELSRYDVQLDTLVFANAPTFTQVDYHGEAALLATYDGGASSVLLIGLDAADIASLNVELMPPGAIF